MRQPYVWALALGCFSLGALGPSGLAQGGRPVARFDVYRDKDAKAAAIALLDGALELAGGGSWERIAVGRAWYLGGDKPKGQQIFDSVTNSKKVEGSDWFRIGRVYAESEEWSKAQQAFTSGFGRSKTGPPRGTSCRPTTGPAAPLRLGGRPFGRAVARRVHRRRSHVRCRPTTVSGRTSTSAVRQFLQMRARQSKTAGHAPGSAGDRSPASS